MRTQSLCAKCSRECVGLALMLCQEGTLSDDGCSTRPTYRWLLLLLLFAHCCCRYCCHCCRCCCCYCCCCRSCCCSPCAFVLPLTASRTLACSLPRSARYLGQVAVDDAKGDTTVAEAARVIARIGARDPPAVFVLVSPSDVKVLLLLVHPTHHHRRCRRHCLHCCCCRIPLNDRCCCC
jgi:hypothetical protein